jgi:acetylornithine deacetylase
VSIVHCGAHMGAATSPIGPIQVASQLVGSLTDLEVELNREARCEPAFDQWQRPVQINVGRIEGGEWHGSSANRCVLMVNLGFPTSYDLSRARLRVEELVRSVCEGKLPYELRFDGIKNEAYLSPENAMFIQQFASALREADVDPGPIGAWTASCDARLYARLLGVPTVIFGAGALGNAHAAHEQLQLSEMFNGMYALSHYFSRPSM